jgi:transcriptional regulator with XRE-family HTH domain
MTDVATLLSEFVDELNAGHQPDAEQFIGRAESIEDRKELAGLIDQSLTLAPESATHPRDASGNFISPVSRQQIDAIVADALVEPRGWEVALPELRESAGMSADELARAALAAGEFEATEENVGVAQRWIGQLERGMLGARDISGAALAAIATALNTSLDALAWEGSASTTAELAFRAEVDDEQLVAEKLSNVSDMLGQAIADQSPVDRWFSAS